MSSSYTCNIEKGISFKEYALGCARAFGAFASLRDEAGNIELPDGFPLDSYHQRELPKAEKELAKYQKMTVKEAAKEAKEFYNKQVTDAKTGIKKTTELKAKYENMLSKVIFYSPPTVDHVKFQDFMRTQIEDSIRFDCGDCYERKLKELKLMTGAQWKKLRVDIAEQDVKNHEEGLSNDIEQNRILNQWIKDLKESIDKVK